MKGKMSLLLGKSVDGVSDTAMNEVGSWQRRKDLLNEELMDRF